MDRFSLCSQFGKSPYKLRVDVETLTVGVDRDVYYSYAVDWRIYTGGKRRICWERSCLLRLHSDVDFRTVSYPLWRIKLLILLLTSVCVCACVRRIDIITLIVLRGVQGIGAAATIPASVSRFFFLPQVFCTYTYTEHS